VNSKKEGKIKFNLSPTSLNTYHQSPLLFYLKYIAKVPDDTKVPVCYGLSGNIVHNCLEKYANKQISRDEAYKHLITEWENKNLHYHKDINNRILNQKDYLMALIKGLQIVDDHENHICEETIQLHSTENEIMKIGIKGIIDLQATQKSNNKNVIIDYKTSNSINQGPDFKRQALFYSFLIHKKKNILPNKTVFHYLKLNTPKVYSFSQTDVQAFEEELNIITNQILEYGIEIGNYPIGNIDDLFNSKRRACEQEVHRRNGYSDIKTFVQMRF
jgi:ATP-dependent helicase/DNAse subunit B